MDKFLVKYDVQTLIDEDNLDEITNANDRTFIDAIDAAVEEVAGYLRHRYDYDKVFKVVQPYSSIITFVVDDRIYWNEPALDIAITYLTGDLVSYLGNIYEANQSVPAEAFDSAKWDLQAENNTFYTCTATSINNLPNDTDFFSAGDNRNAKIKQVTLDVVLYNIHSKISPRSVPEVRLKRYDGMGNKKDSGNALAYLEKVQKGVVTLDLPVIEPTVQNTERFSYGTTSNVNHNY